MESERTQSPKTTVESETDPEERPKVGLSASAQIPYEGHTCVQIEDDSRPRVQFSIVYDILKIVVSGEGVEDCPPVHHESPKDTAEGEDQLWIRTYPGSAFSRGSPPHKGY